MNPGEGDAVPGVAQMRWFSRAAAGVVLLLACAVMVGWVLGIRVLTSVFPDYNTMKFNAAACLAALAAVALLGRRPASWIALAAVGAVAGATFVEIVTGYSLGLDQLLFRDRYGTSSPAGRMAPATTVALLALVTAQVAAFTGRRRTAQAVLAVPATIGAVALIGYLYDVEQLYRVASLSSVALHTAAALLLLALAVLATIPDGFLHWYWTGPGPGALMVRRSAPVIAGGMVLVGFGWMRARSADVFGEHFGIALMVLIGTVIAAGATLRVAWPLDVADRARAEAEDTLHELITSLQDGRDEAWAKAEELRADLARERRRFDRAISSTDAVVWTVETTTGSPEPVYSSPNVARVLGDGLRPEESLTTALIRLADDDQRARAEEFDGNVRAGRDDTCELRLSVAGRAKWLRVQGVPRREDERHFYDGIITDATPEHAISEQRELLLLKERLQVKKLAELNQMRDEFIAIAGHELRTPVAVILGYLEMISGPGASAESIAEGVEVISRRANQLSELVERVFDLAKIDSGAMDLHVEPVEARTFLDDLLAAHQPRAEAAGVTLAADVPPVYVLADRTRLQQIFDNLLSNALKYTPTGGHIRLAVTTDDSGATFTVADDGIGVSAEELPRIFERLFRATNAREARIPGTGLGLAVTKALVEAQAGTLTASANDPRGMVFRVTLPTLSADAAVGSR